MLLISFPVGNATAPICGGMEMHPGELMTAGPGTQFHARSDGVSHWASIRLPVARLLKYSIVSTDAACLISPIVQRWRLPASTYRHVRSLHAAAIRMAARCPRALVDLGPFMALSSNCCMPLWIVCRAKQSARAEPSAGARRTWFALSNCFEGGTG